MSEYKNIEYHPDSVIITHYLLEEYSDKDEPQYTYDTFYQHILQRYEHTESKGMCKILNKRNQTITIQMPRYNVSYPDPRFPNILQSPIEFCSPEALCKLFHWMFKNKIIQIDFAPRNIGQDENGDLHIIDLDTTSELVDSDETKYLQWLQEYDCEFINSGLGDNFQAAIQLFRH